MNTDYTVGKIVDLGNGCRGKILHTDYIDDPLAFWMSENKWKDQELRYLNKKLLETEAEVQCLRRKLYFRK